MKIASCCCVVCAVALWFTVLATAKEPDDAKKIETAKKVLGEAKIDFAEAFATARKKVGEGKPLIGRVEMIKKSARFGFYFLQGEKVQEVEIDAKSGAVVKFEEKTEGLKAKKFADAIKSSAGAKVGFKKGMEIGATKAKGQLIEVEFELDGDKAFLELEYLASGKITRVRIDTKDPSSVTVK
ncbi:MAG: hypothetical protein U0793_00815 [Gemmataceae bacterium]